MALNFNPIIIILHSHSQSSFLLLLFTILSHTSLIPLCLSQSSPSNNSPQNIETFYPIPTPSSNFSPSPSPEQLFPPPSTAVAKSSSSTRGKIAKAVAATAAATLVVSGIIFFLVQRFCLGSSRRNQEAVIVPHDQAQSNNNNNNNGGFERIEGNVRGLIVDENGLDVVYWRKLQGRNSSLRGLKKEIFRMSKKKEKHQEEEFGGGDDDDEGRKKGRKSEKVQEFPLLRGKSSTSHINIEDESSSNRVITRKNKTEHLPPPPKSARTRPAPPPPPPSTAGTRGNNSSGESTSDSSNGHVKLKPLHRDKANTTTNAEHTSLGFDQDMMEALFGYVATRKSPKGKNDSVNLNREASLSGQ